RAARLGHAVLLLDEQPVLPVLRARPDHAHQHPAARELLALEVELEPALAIALARVLARLPAAAIPHDHRAGAVLPFGNRALEPVVLDGMTLGLDSEPLLRRV